MDKAIESKFFEAFKWGGVVDKCITWMRHTYNLPMMKPSDDGDNEEKQQSKGTSKEDEKWDKFYREILPKEILEATEAFDDTVIKYMDSPLIDEIEENLNDCQTDAQKERYFFSLLKPFGEPPSGCGFANVYHPIAEINQLKDEIKELERTKASWQAVAEKEPLKSGGIDYKGQVEACDSMIKRRKEQIEWVLYVNEKFCNLTGRFEDGAKWMQVGTVENCLSGFCGIVHKFANRLDALLLTYGIDLMKLQRESGLYLKSHRIITDIDCYIGSIELTKRYINALPKESTAVPKQDIAKPQQETEREKKYFAKAIEAGLMEKKGNENYKWLHNNGMKASLAYFLNRVFNPKGTTQIPYQRLEVLFGVTRLDTALDQVLTAKKPQKWRKEIDTIFDD